MNELPEGWRSATLGAVCSKPQYGWTSRAAKSGRVRYVRTTDISSGQIDWPSVPFCEDEPEDLEKYLIRKDDILVSRAGSVGLSYRVDDVPAKAVFASYLIRFNVRRGVDPQFIENFLKSKAYWEAISDSTAGIAIPNVNASKLGDIELPLAPSAEQYRIAAKIKAILVKVDASYERLDKIQIILKRFRQGVLAAGCDGRLTADWRAAKGAAPSLSPGADEALFDVPDGWSWKTVASVCARIVDCPHSTPQWTDSGRLCVRTTNFKPGVLDLSEVRFVSEETYQERIERLCPEPGDVLYSREGGILGIACVIPPGVNLCLGQRMMLFRVSTDFDGTLLMNWLNNPLILRRVVELTGGSASPHLNVGDIKEFPIPFPPPDEQQEIVRRISELFTLADRLEARYEKAKAHMDRLSASILAKAFRGELVISEAELARREGRVYETAEELLARIKNERTQPPMARPARNGLARRVVRSTRRS